MLRVVGIALGIFLAAVAFTFWKLDQRTAFLIKHAEQALQEAETLLFPTEATPRRQLKRYRNGDA